MTAAPERPDPEAARAQDEWDASLPHENGLLQTAPERPDLTFEEARHKIVGWADCCFGEFNVSDAEDEAARVELDAVLRAIAAPAPDAGLRAAAFYAIAVYDLTHLRHDVAYETVADALDDLRAALSRQEKETA